MFLLVRTATVVLGLIAGLSSCQAQTPGGPRPNGNRQAPRLVDRAYLVGDLVLPRWVRNDQPGKPHSEALVTLVKSKVAPGSWDWTGGRGTIDYFPLGMAIAVSQTEDVQQEVAELLATLRFFDGAFNAAIDWLRELKGMIK